MPHAVSYLEDDGIVFCEYTLPYGPHDFPVAIADNLVVAAEHGSHLFLADCRPLGTQGSLIDAYGMGELLDKMVADRHAREALVIVPDTRTGEIFDFLVTVTTNRGLIMRVFAGIDEAKVWLREQGRELEKVLNE
ncbi:MAG TPA: hypothetical protein VFG89_10860 [Coriobacteriia bacterium]|nr:hypothetical protein [Coriobacteriia bacterium]